MNISVDWMGSDQETVVGYKIDKKNLATRQSHLMTIDKTVLTMLVNETFKPQAFDERQSIKTFGKREGVLISDFDRFMYGGNPIVTQKPEILSEIFANSTTE